MTTCEIVDVELSQEDRALILQYGYPFPRIEDAVRALDGSSSVETVALDRFYLRKLVGDLCRSIKESDDQDLRSRLDDLCERLEFL
jgi:hypothetical protein